MKILLLNPPSADRHLRGNYCSNVSKGIYYYPAIDLLVQSGVLSRHFEITVCDAVAEKLSGEEVLSLVAAGGFGGVYAVTGTSSRSSDLVFFRRLKGKMPDLRLLVTGGYLLSEYETVLTDCPWLDGVHLDWSTDESVRFFQGDVKGSTNLVTQHDMQRTAPPEAKVGVLRYPRPRHELFPLRAYHHPNARKHPFSLLIASYGCPYACDYCIYSVTPYRTRPVEDVLEEMRYLNSIGVREAFFHDPTFAAKRADALALCEALTEENLGVGWFCQTRVDVMDEELLMAMRRAGCHAIMFGVESANEALLKEHTRRVKHAKTREVYAMCRKLGIQTLSYLVIGLPGDTEATIADTVQFVKEIGSNFVSFNLAIPVVGTAFRNRLVKEGLTSSDMIEFDNSDDQPVVSTRALTPSQLAKAHRAAIRSFYLRPGYMVSRLAKIRSVYELKNQIREGWAMLRAIFQRG